MDHKLHIPVMINEIKEYLNLGPGKIIVDATVGTGGHSRMIVESILPGGKLIGIDRDEESLDVSSKRLSDFGSSCAFVHGNFCDIDTILQDLKIEKVDGMLFDLGISSYQLDNPQRGFSFQDNGPLDMRLDRNSYISAYDLVNNLNEEEISNLLWIFGEERFHNRIAHLLVQERQKHAISTTTELSDIVVKAVPYKYRYYRTHPATRTFQAMRIAVNRELEVLEKTIEKAVSFLNPGGRICIISFHSLEDRIVKINFRKLTSCGIIDIITNKPLQPALEEVKVNPSSRSAKLRVAQKV